MTALYAVTVKLTPAQIDWIDRSLTIRAYTFGRDACPDCKAKLQGHLALARQLRAAMLDPPRGVLVIAHHGDGRD